MTRALLVLFAVVALAPAARADDRPWAAGVSPEKQAAALATFTRGNDAFAQADYATAAQLYREALADWSHPAIHGNLAVALVHLDRPIDAYLELEAAFAYGAAPFDPIVYAQLQTNYKLLRGQVSRLAVTGDLAGATVLLDGNGLAPGRHVVRAGSHELVARRVGFLTFSRSVVTSPDTDHTIDVRLVPLSEASRLTRRWAVWKPWAVAAGGALVTLAGVGLELAARSNADAYELEIARACPAGCLPADIPSSVSGLEARARWQTRLGVTSLVVGGAVIATGLTLVVLNQPRRLRVDESGRVVHLAPLLDEHGAGLAAIGAF